MTSIETTEAEQLLAKSGWLRHLATSLAIDSEEGEDIYHETLVAAWQKRADAERKSDSWLASVVLKKANRSHRNRQRRERRESSVARPEAQPATVDVVAKVELQRIVVDAVMALEEPYRTTMLLRFWEEQKPGQIAAQLEVPVETVRTRVKRGLEKLRLRLDAQFGSRAAWLLPFADHAGIKPSGMVTTTGTAGILVAVAATVMLAGIIGYASLDTISAPDVADEIASEADSHVTHDSTSTERILVATAVEAAADGPVREVVAVAESTRVRMTRGIDVLHHDWMGEIVEAQAAFRKKALSDRDDDSLGEFGYFQDLTMQQREGRWRPGFLPPARFTQGVRVRGDYVFRMYLPDSRSYPIPEAMDGGVGRTIPDADLSEQLWACYAWPLRVPAGCTPGPVLFVDQSGEVITTANPLGRYVGVGGGPQPDAVFGRETQGRLGDRRATDKSELGRDGEAWQPCFVAETKARVTFEVEVEGKTMEGVTVGVLVDPSGYADPELVRQQRAVLKSLDDLWLPLASSKKVGKDGKVTMEGRAVRDVTILVRIDNLGTTAVPTQIERDGSMIILRVAPPYSIAPGQKNANESAAIATLKNIASSQAQCQASAVIDSNTNGAGEYGFFAELAGACRVRSDASGSVGTNRVSPPVLSNAFGKVEDSIVTRSGYHFRMYLPGAGYLWQSEAAEGGGKGVFVDSSSAEVLWCCYAWPTKYGKSGSRSFFVNQGGDVLATRAQFSGKLSQPRTTAAYVQGDEGLNMGSPIAANKTGYDGQAWIVVN